VPQENLKRGGEILPFSPQIPRFTISHQLQETFDLDTKARRMTVECRDRINSLLALLLPPPQIRTEFSTPRLLTEPSNVVFCLCLPNLEKYWRRKGETFHE